MKQKKLFKFKLMETIQLMHLKIFLSTISYKRALDTEKPDLNIAVDDGKICIFIEKFFSREVEDAVRRHLNNLNRITALLGSKFSYNEANVKLAVNKIAPIVQRFDFPNYLLLSIKKGKLNFSLS